MKLNVVIGTTFFSVEVVDVVQQLLDGAPQSARDRTRDASGPRKCSPTRARL